MTVNFFIQNDLSYSYFLNDFHDNNVYDTEQRNKYVINAKYILELTNTNYSHFIRKNNILS
jgi:hypothetical protein